MKSIFIILFFSLASFTLNAQVFIERGTCYEALNQLEISSEKDSASFVDTFLEYYDIEGLSDEQFRDKFANKSFREIKAYFKDRPEYKCTLKFLSNKKRFLLGD